MPEFRAPICTAGAMRTRRLSADGLSADGLSAQMTAMPPQGMPTQGPMMPPGGMMHDMRVPAARPA